MNNKEIVKYFYETVASSNLLDEVSNYIAKDCTVKIGEKIITIGIDGMKQHLIVVKQLIFTGVDIDKIQDGKIVEHGGAVNTFETLFEAGIVKPN